MQRFTKTAEALDRHPTTYLLPVVLALTGGVAAGHKLYSADDGGRRNFVTIRVKLFRDYAASRHPSWDRHVADVAKFMRREAYGD